jgi:hypothetical protein
MSLKNLAAKAKEQRGKTAVKKEERHINYQRRELNKEDYSFDYNVNFRDIEKFTRSKKLLAAEVGKKFGESASIIEHGAHFQFYPPVEPEEEDWNDEDRRDIVRIQYQADYQAFVRQKSEYDTRCAQCYHLIWSKCTSSMKNAVKQDPDYEHWDRNNDALRLWLSIVDISMNGAGLPDNDVKRQNEARHRFDRMRQRSNESTGDFYDRFIDHYEAMESQGARLFEVIIPELNLEGYFNDQAQQAQITQIREESRQREERMKAMSFINKLDRTRYQHMLDELENSFQFGRDEYPETLVDAYALACRYREKGQRVDGNIAKGEKYGAAFAAVKNAKTKAKDSSNDAKGAAKSTRCYLCEQDGHIRPRCPILVKAIEYIIKTGKSLEELEKDIKTKAAIITIRGLEEYILETSSRPFTNNDVLLDNQASVNVFNNKNLLTNIRKTREPIYVAGVGKGEIYADLEGDFDGYGTVYYAPECIANILCLFDMNKNYGVIFKKNKLWEQEQTNFNL